MIWGERKYRHIGYNEECGILVPKNLTKNRKKMFLRDTFHIDTIHKITGIIEFGEEYIDEEYLDDEYKNLNFTDKDKQALLAWEDMHGMSISHEDFAIEYLNVAKIGSNAGVREHDIIVTTDNTPYITFEDYLRDRFRLYHTQDGVNFDPDKKIFVPRLPSEMEIILDREKRAQIESEVGQI